MKEFNFLKELHKIYEEEIIGKSTNSGRIYRKLRARDKEFIKKLKEHECLDPSLCCLNDEIDKFSGDKL